MRWYNKIRPEQWFWILAKLSLSGLSGFYILCPQYGPLRRVHPFVDTAGYSMVIVGCVLSIVGLVLSAMYWGEKMKTSLLVDLVGIIFIVCGTFTFLVGRLSVALRDDVALERVLGGILFSFTITCMFTGRALLKSSLMKEIE